MILAEYIVGMLLEDRIDDLIARYPENNFTRSQLTSWMGIDPTNNKKYFTWIVRQIVDKKLKPSSEGERLHDDLMAFERFLSIPAFTGSRDIQQYDAKSLAKTIRKFSTLQSKSQKEREARTAGAKTVAKVGNLECVKITHAQELMNRAWSAYAASNPNWTGKPLKSPQPGQEEEEEWDGLWCVRFPRYASSYLSEGPFYLVYKDGGPYVGIVWEKGECQTLNNRGISLGIAEEIYPVVKDIMPKDLIGRCSIFANLKFLRGEIADGTTVSPDNRVLDLADSTLSKLPAGLTVKGSLNVAGTPLTALPPGLTIEGGKLSIQGTRITQLPLDLVTPEMEWSAPLSQEEVTKLYFRNKIGEMKSHFWEVKRSEGVSDDRLEAEWQKFQPGLVDHFLKSGEVANNLRIIYRNVGRK